MPSEAQLAANRLNAQKSTGPRTDAGKAIASRNSLKHTALARALLVSSHPRQESSPEFKILCDEYYAALDPVGPLEEMLVDSLVSAVWRRDRVRHAESGEIALNLDETEKTGPKTDPIPTLLHAAEAADREDIPQMLAQSIPGCEYILRHLREAQAAVQRDQRLTPDSFNQLNSAFRLRAKALIDPLYEMAVTLETNPGKIDPAILLQKHRSDVFSYFQSQLKYYEEMLDAKRQNPDLGTKARQDAAMLPSGHAVDRILRYDTVLERQIFRAMDQLEKLQSRRLVAPKPSEGGLVAPKPSEGGLVAPKPSEGGLVAPKPNEAGLVTPKPSEGGLVAP